jgi:hypothetical protein
MNWNNTETGDKKILTCKTVVFNSGLENIFNIQADLDLVYAIDNRFLATITKEKMHSATSVVDIVPREAEWSKVSFLNMTVAVLQDNSEIRELGDNEVLNAAQIKLLQSIDYSTSLYIKGRCKKKNGGPDGLKDMDQEEFDFAYYITVIPEKEAEYSAGYDALVNYLWKIAKQQLL